MIHNQNLDPTLCSGGWQSVYLPINVGASATAQIQSGHRIPFAGKLVSAYVYCATITDADDSARVDLFNNAASILPATIDPVTADTTTSLAPNATTFAAGDKVTVRMTTGAGDAMVGGVTLVYRPLMGAESGAL